MPVAEKKTNHPYIAIDPNFPHAAEKEISI